MTSDDLYRAILAMDSYNRGYGRGIAVNGNQIGNITVGAQKGDQSAHDISFFAQAYMLPTGRVIISFRGTDNKLLDILNGYGVGIGSPFWTQAKMAIDFYKSIATATGADPLTANIELTGHSLGGGLAGYVGALYQKTGLLFDYMPFQTAAENAQLYASNVYNDLPLPLDVSIKVDAAREAARTLTRQVLRDLGVDA